MTAGERAGRTPRRAGSIPSPAAEFAVDWDKAGLWVTRDGREVEHLKGVSIRQFVEDTAPARIYLEPTFESASWEEHNAVVDLAEELGTELWAVATRASGRQVRTKLELEDSERTRTLQDERKAESNVLAALAIWDLAHSDYHLKRVGRMAERPFTLTRRVIQSRQAGYRDEESRRLLGLLPEPRDLEDWARTALADGPDGGGGRSSYAAGFVVPLCMAAEQAGSRDEFDRIVGAYGHGYPSVFRSNFYYSRTRTMERRGMTSKEAMRLLRRSTRLVYHLVKAKGREDPEKGNDHPGLEGDAGDGGQWRPREGQTASLVPGAR